MMTRKRFNEVSGFTLIESVMAIMILGFALSACVLSFSESEQAVKTAANQMAALHSARYELETLRTLSLTNSSLLNAGSHGFTNGSVVGIYTVSNLNSCTKSVAVTVNYLNYINYTNAMSTAKGASTNTLTTILTSTLHP
jgi:prepilin-type N-terminal cleavage/methylation domain-containing protein